jgi:acyl-CoA thioester hydrolase
MNLTPRMLDDYPIRTSEKLRFADTDRNGHITNSVFAVCCQNARMELLCDPRRVPIPSGTQFVVARLVLEFHTEMHWPGTVEIGTRIDRIGRSSVMLNQALFVSDACVATSESLVVLIDAGTRRSTSLPAETVAALEAIIDSNAHVPWHAAIPRSSVTKPVMLNAREESSDVAPGQTPARPLHREPSCNADRSISR